MVAEERVLNENTISVFNLQVVMSDNTTTSIWHIPVKLNVGTDSLTAHILHFSRLHYGLHHACV